MRRIALIAAVAAGLAGGAAAEGANPGEPSATKNNTQAKAVVELFTSQGCSSCPTADAVLGKLADRGDIVALSFSIDYWDYLGWKDTLSNPKFTERQRAYAKSFGQGIYTPQAIINGAVHINGSDEAKIKVAIDEAIKQAASGQVPIRLRQDGDKLVVDAGVSGQALPVKDATLWLAVIAKTVEVPITRGENRGQTLTYRNVVRELTPIGMWNGKAMTVQLDRQTFMTSRDDGCAVLLQQGRAGPILGAALLSQF